MAARLRAALVILTVFVPSDIVMAILAFYSFTFPIHFLSHLCMTFISCNCKIYVIPYKVDNRFYIMSVS